MWLSCNVVFMFRNISMVVVQHPCFDFSFPSPLPRPSVLFVLLLRSLLLRRLLSSCEVMMLAEMWRRLAFALAGNLPEGLFSFVIVSAMLLRDTRYRISPFKRGPCHCLCDILHPLWMCSLLQGGCSITCTAPMLHSASHLAAQQEECAQPSWLRASACVRHERRRACPNAHGRACPNARKHGRSW